MCDSFTGKIKNRIDILGEGAVFIANDFLEIADYETVRRALNRMLNAEMIQRILCGVYYSPHFNDFLQEHIAPDPHLVALAIARKFSGSSRTKYAGLVHTGSRSTYLCQQRPLQ